MSSLLRLQRPVAFASSVLPRRTFAASAAARADQGKFTKGKESKVATDKYPDDQHVTNHKDRLSIQGEYSGKGRECVNVDVMDESAV